MAGEAAAATEDVQEQALGPEPTAFDKAMMAKAREHLLGVYERMQAFDHSDGFVDAPDAAEIGLRTSWWVGAKAKLVAAPDNASFMEAIEEVSRSVLTDMGDAAPSKPSRMRVEFAAVEWANLQEMKGLIAANPMGSDRWRAFMDEPSKPASPARMMERARFVKATMDCGGSEQSAVDSKKRELVERFGFSGVAIEGSQNMTLMERHSILAKMQASLAEASKDMGLAERDMGMRGEYVLRIMDGEANKAYASREGYMAAAGGKRLALAAGTSDIITIRHEWAHMLDYKLGEKLKLMAEDAGSGLSDFERSAVNGKFFFSEMPLSAQRFMPGAKEGVWNILGAAQGVADGARGFEALAAREAKLMDYAAERAVVMASGDASLWASLPPDRYRELCDEMKCAVKGLLRAPEVASALLMEDYHGGAPRLEMASRWASLESGDIHDRLAHMASTLDGQFGDAWRKGPDGAAAAGQVALAEHLTKALEGPLREEAKALAYSSGGESLSPMNPQSRFANASQLANELWRNKNYFNDPKEMLARAAGHVSGLQNLESYRRAKRALKDLGKFAGAPRSQWTETFEASYYAELGGAGQEQLSRGLAQMGAAAGIDIRQDPRKTLGARIEALASEGMGAKALAWGAGALESAAVSVPRALEAFERWGEDASTKLDTAWRSLRGAGLALISSQRNQDAGISFSHAVMNAGVEAAISVAPASGQAASLAAAPAEPVALDNWSGAKKLGELKARRQQAALAGPRPASSLAP